MIKQQVIGIGILSYSYPDGTDEVNCICLHLVGDCIWLVTAFVSWSPTAARSTVVPHYAIVNVTRRVPTS